MGKTDNFPESLSVAACITEVVYAERGNQFPEKLMWCTMQ